MQFERTFVRGCLQGYKFQYQFHTPLEQAQVYALRQDLGGRITEVQGTQYFSLDVPGIGLMTGLYGGVSAVCIFRFGNADAATTLDAALVQLEREKAA